MKVEPTDHELIEAANRGSAEAFEGLYFRYRDWVYRLAWRITGNEDLAQDVVQEAFTYFLKKFPGFELTARMTTFLYPVVKHLSIAIRDKNRRMVSDDELLTSVPAATYENLDESRQELAQVVNRLPGVQQEAILMRFVDGMSLAEIAEALEISSGTVKSRIYRGLEALREDPKTKKYFQD